MSTGLSPRVRGSHRLGTVALQALGSIPACAGEPPSTASSSSAAWVYPRVCGGARYPSQVVPLFRGLSPRVRGSLGRDHAERLYPRSIPACAGEPGMAPAPVAAPGVYPRVCGGAPAPGTSPHSSRGLSPRVRGSPKSIGAGARRVYPRVCGGAVSPAYTPGSGKGLSPRVRGSHTGRRDPGSRGGSIPACAGEPRRTARPSRSSWVYPRVCGGAPGSTGMPWTRRGLSPRVRGSLAGWEHWVLSPGSIPACAGEPLLRDDVASVLMVYPRVCGGASED